VKRDSIIVMLCFARSGGTLLAKCLNSLQKVVLLSEINPAINDSEGYADSIRTVKNMSSRWYDIELRTEGYVENICELNKMCSERGRTVVVRDWTVINFWPNRDNDYSPSCRLDALDVLERNFNVIPFVFLRDAIDVFLSLGVRSVNDFFPHYLKYVKAVFDRKIRVFKYEEFCSTPVDTFRSICQYTNLEFSHSFLNFQNVDHVTGDVAIKGGSRGGRKAVISVLPRKYRNKKNIAELDGCVDMQEANRICGYPSCYSARRTETLIDQQYERITRKLRALVLSD